MILNLSSIRLNYQEMQLQIELKNTKNPTIAVQLTYLSNFWRSLEMPLINFKVEFKLKWIKYCALSKAVYENIINDNYSDNNYFYYQRHKIMCSCSNPISNRQTKFIKTSQQWICKISLLE